MNFRDRMVTDSDGRRFVFTVEMQRRLSEAGLPVEPAYLAQLDDVIVTPAVERESSGNGRGSTYRDDAEDNENGSSDVLPAPTTIQIDPETGKYIGRVKWYNARKGYGFLIRGAGEEIFFHKSNSTADPELYQEGQWILYDVEETRKGPEATEIESYTGDTSLIELDR